MSRCLWQRITVWPFQLLHLGRYFIVWGGCNVSILTAFLYEVFCSYKKTGSSMMLAGHYYYSALIHAEPIVIVFVFTGASLQVKPSSRALIVMHSGLHEVALWRPTELYCSYHATCWAYIKS
jgi:hypothetical protein